ncbi:MAG: UDP-4-amino-4,6-dideoxy-N-acetyl-beta-L-altrosamine transaminase [bacterium]
MKDDIPYGRQWIEDDEIEAVVKVLRSDWITQGPKIEEFEGRLAEYCGTRFAVAVSSGTAALHMACLTAGIGKDDEVIISPITFIASSNCVLYCGGRPVFADIEEDTANIDSEEIKKRITSKTKAIIPVHFAGHPCDLEAIGQIAKENNLIIIEDACHALGAEYRIQKSEWVKVGSCKHSDMTVFSFHPVKHITTGEGGAVLTNDEELYKRLKIFRNHGITRDPEDFVNTDLAFPSSPGPWYYEMQALGYNYRITDFQCALGIKQLEKADRFVERRRDIAAEYTKAFKDMDEVITPGEREKVKASYHLYVIQVKSGRLNRRDVFENLRKEGIGVQVHYIPVHLQPYYQQNLGYKKGAYPKAEQFYERALSLPIFPKMNDQDVERVIKSTQRVIRCEAE